jgi:hypothetical protein
LAVTSGTFKRPGGESLVCPGEGTLEGKFNLYTDNLPTETPLSIS